jgi:hypothetical protein
MVEVFEVGTGLMYMKLVHGVEVFEVGTMLKCLKLSYKVEVCQLSRGDYTRW